jgi:FMN-dependent NADH-azoreductase
VVLSRLNVGACIACNRCFENGRCAVQDDFQVLYDKTLEADGIMLAAPIFFMNLNAQAKAFVDRFQSLWALRYVLEQPLPPPTGGQRRRAIFLSAAGSPKTKFECSLSVVRAFLGTIDAKLVGRVCINGIDDAGEVSEHPEVLDQAHALGALLAAGEEHDDAPE